MSYGDLNIERGVSTGQNIIYDNDWIYFFTFMKLIIKNKYKVHSAF